METREKILHATAELFFRFGIRSVTMDDIAKHLSMSKKTIYQYFRDKDELIHCLMEDMLKRNRVEFQEIYDNSENVIMEVLNTMKHIGQMFSKMNPSIFNDLQKYHPDSWRLFTDFKEEYMEKMVIDSIERGIKDGLVRKDLNAKVVSRLRIGEVEMGMDPKLFPPAQYSLAEVQVAMIDHFLHGICTLKGHRMVNNYKNIKEEEE